MDGTTRRENVRKFYQDERQVFVSKCKNDPNYARKMNKIYLFYE